MNNNLVENIDRITCSYAIPAKLSKHDAWLRLELKMEHEVKVIKPDRVRTNMLAGWIAAAAVFGVVMYLGMFYTGKYSNEFITGNTATQQIFLPDSSSVFLNYNSKVKYHYNKFTGERNVVLNGEAQFNVQKGRKFSVDFNGGSISVLGTRFTVMAYSPDYVNIACTDGKVEFRFGKKVKVIKAGEGINIYKGQQSETLKSECEQINERINGLYFWNKISIDELIHLIGFRFGYNVRIHPDIINRNFSGKIDLSDLHNALNIVSFAMDLNYIIDEDGQTITVNAK